MKTSHIGIIVLVLITILFATGVGVGTLGKTETDADWTESLKNVFVSDDPLQVTEAPCRFEDNTLRVAQGAPCEVTIKEGKILPVRTLKLCLIGLGEVDVELVLTGEDAPVVTGKLSDSTTPKMQVPVFKGGAKLTLTVIKASSSTPPLFCTVQINCD